MISSSVLSNPFEMSDTTPSKTKDYGVNSYYFNISESQDDFNVTDFMTSQMEKNKSNSLGLGIVH